MPTKKYAVFTPKQYNDMKESVNAWAEYLKDKNSPEHFDQIRNYEQMCVALLNYEIKNDLLIY